MKNFIADFVIITVLSLSIIFPKPSYADEIIECKDRGEYFLCIIETSYGDRIIKRLYKKRNTELH